MNDTLRLLVVDDEPGMCKGTQRALRDFTAEFADLQLRVGFAVELAATGEEALELICREVPDLLLLDYKLPGISGLELQEHLAARNLEVLTVMMSAYSSLQTVITATKRGAYDFLVKPFTPDELRFTLEKAAHHLLIQRQALKLAEERRQVRFEFIRVLGHELKAPLAAVEGYLRLLQKRALGEQLTAYDEALARSLIRLAGMRKLILDLLDLTRIESGNKQRVLAEVDLCDVVRAAAETATPEASARRIVIRSELPTGLVMTADRGELEIILNNLISNAIKYNRQDGSVVVRARDLGDQAELEVADTGIGMGPEDVRKLFGEFVRIKNEKTAAILGSGLGLSIVRKLASLYGGDATVASSPDVGSTFTVRLRKSPLAPAGPRSTEAPEQADGIG